MNKRGLKKLALNRETLLALGESALERAQGGAALAGNDTDPTVCRTREYSSCCPPDTGKQ